MNITIGALVQKTKNSPKTNGLALIAGIGLSVAAVAGAIGFAARPTSPNPANLASTFQAPNVVEDPMYAVRPDLYATNSQAALSSEWTAEELAAIYPVRFDVSAQPSTFSEWTAEELAAIYAVRSDLYGTRQPSALSSEWTAEELAAIYAVRTDLFVRTQPLVLSPEWVAHSEAVAFAGQPDRGVQVFGGPEVMGSDWLALLEADRFEMFGFYETHVFGASENAVQFSFTAEWTAYLEAEQLQGEVGRGTHAAAH